jgi:Cof subfamily protein (haloacid dehalogenase superfamily)
MKPALLAIDLDGTLIDHSLTLREPVIRAVHRAAASGVIVTIVTGRMFAATLPFAKRLGVTAPVVCYQGAAIFDTVSAAAIRETPLPNAVALEAYSYAKQHGIHAQVYLDDRFYAEELNEYSQLYARLSGVQPLIVPSLVAALDGRDPTKMNVIVLPERTPAVEADLRALVGESAYITRSNPEFVEMMNPASDKGRAFIAVAERLGVPLDRTMAIGDSYNDIPLLKAAALGVAMGSGPAPLKDAADAVVSDWAHDGVAEAIDRFVFGVEAVA